MAKKKARNDSDELVANPSNREAEEMTGERSHQAIAANALPLALLGAGLGWFLMQRLRDDETERRRERTTSGTGSAARRRTAAARSGVEEALDRSPFAVGAAVFALGVLGGVALPSSRWENEALGDKSDALKHGVKDRARDFRETASTVAREKAESLRSDAQRMGARLLTGSALELARNAAESASARNRSTSTRNERSRSRE